LVLALISTDLNKIFALASTKSQHQLCMEPALVVRWRCDPIGGGWGSWHGSFVGEAVMAILLGAGLLEIVRAISLKYTDGFTRFWPSAIGIAAAVVSFLLLATALKSLPVGTAYAV
jgi:Small Multidrug Resistance protein